MSPHQRMSKKVLIKQTGASQPALAFGRAFEPESQAALDRTIDHDDLNESQVRLSLNIKPVLTHSRSP